MPLDNAQFIAELSVTDPPGTDPLNQGDDHIRTIKLAVQQSFPNVGSAVPQTGVQMAQMAIKNEANDFLAFQTFTAGATFVAPSFGVDWTFSGQVAFTSFAPTVGGVGVALLSTNTFTGRQFFPDGTALLPSIAFAGQTDTGIYRPGTSIGFTVGGVDVAFMLGNQMRYSDGQNAAPAYSFREQSNSGMWRGSSTQLNFSTGGVHGLTLSTIQLQSQHDGTAAFPGYAFASDPGTGITATATSLDISANGVSIAAFTSTSDIFAGIGRSWAGQTARTAARPAFNFSSDSDTGFYNAAANSIGWATAGISRGTMDASAIWTANGVSFHGDGASSVSNPAYAFTNDVATGMFRSAAAKLGWGVGGQLAMTLEGGTVSTQLTINQTAGTGAIHTFLQNGVLRWQSGAVGTNQESWSVTRFSDAGAFLNTLFDINRATGNIRMPALPTTNPGGSGRLWKSGGFVAIT